jgi:hypothetical protein
MSHGLLFGGDGPGGGWANIVPNNTNNVMARMKLGAAYPRPGARTCPLAGSGARARSHHRPTTPLLSAPPDPHIPDSSGHAARWHGPASRVHPLAERPLWSST